MEKTAEVHSLNLTQKPKWKNTYKQCAYMDKLLFTIYTIVNVPQLWKITQKH